MIGRWRSQIHHDRLVRLIGVVVALSLTACSGLRPSATSQPPTLVAVPAAAVTATASPAPAATPITTPAASTTAPTPTASPFTAEPNVALKGKATASGGQDSTQRAIDGDLNTIWSAGDYPVQWYLVTLDKLYLVDRIELVVTQQPAGKTSHEVWLGNASGSLTLAKKFTDVTTADGDTLLVTLSPGQVVNRVLVRTTSGPSFVAWKEVRVFGVDATTSAAAAAPAPGSPQWIDWPNLALSGGFNLPVQVTNAGDGTGRLFVVEQHGTIRVVKNGAPLDAPFLSIPDLVKCCEEQGMLSIAFPPGYAQKGYFYVSYTEKSNALVIARYHLTSNPDVADPTSAQLILSIPEPTTVHHSGHLVFGPKDGYLYIGSGDGGEPADQNKRAQNPGLLNGKLLRIDTESGVAPYAIPPTNPFVNQAGYRPEIWALGFRNPWGFSFDQQTGDLFVGDVGEDNYEEIDYQPASSKGGENYGWPTMEGLHCFSAPSCSQNGLVLPVLEYTHQEGCAVMGGTVYRGQKYPRMLGFYYYADLCSGRVWGLHRDGDSWQTSQLLTAPFQVSSIGQDEAGDLWLTDYNHGGLVRLVDQPPTTPTPSHN